MEEIYSWVSPQWNSFTGQVAVITYLIKVKKIPIIKNLLISKMPQKVIDAVREKGWVPLQIHIYKVGETFWEEKYKAVVYAGSKGLTLLHPAVWALAAFVAGAISSLLIQWLLNISVEDIKTFFKKAAHGISDVWNFIKLMGLMYMGYLMMVAMAALIHRTKAPTPPHVVIVEKGKELVKKVG